MKKFDIPLRTVLILAFSIIVISEHPSPKSSFLFWFAIMGFLSTIFSIIDFIWEYNKCTKIKQWEQKRSKKLHRM